MTENQPILSPNARFCALTALAHALDKGKPLASAWAADRYFEDLSPSDRGFAQLLAKTTLRRMGQIDDIINHFFDLELPSRASRIRHILRLGAAQLLWLDIAAQSAVNSSIEMTKRIQMEKYGAPVGAALKRVAQEGPALIAAQDEAKINMPAWLWERLEKAYGEVIARRIAEIHLKEPPVDITVKSNPALWAKELGGVALPLGSVRLPRSGNIAQLKGFAEGDWWPQDLASTIPARLLGNVKNKRVIDLGAAPDGKTAQLAFAGATVSAIGATKERVAMLKTSVHRLKLHADYVTTDASKWLPSFSPDAILLDATCSNTGVIRRQPDVPWRIQPEDIPRFTAAQDKLLRHAVEMLKSGGTLVYAANSLLPEECEQRIEQLLKERKDVIVSPVLPSEIGGLAECLTKRGEVRSLPCHLADLDGIDGLYVARLTKK